MIHAIILAAGLSRRMGTQKLLLPWAGRTVVAHIANQLAAADGVGGIVAVTRAGSGVAEALAGSARGKLRIVTNPDPNADMLRSVRCGLRALPDDSEGFLVALGDQPTIAAALIDRMIAALRSHAGPAAGGGIVVPAHKGRRGHPILFAASYRQEILTRFDGVGLRGLLEAHAEDVLDLPEAGPGILTDLDFPDDYRRALAEGGE